MKDYIHQFVILAAAPMNVTKEVLESAFLNGLRTEIFAEVLVMTPIGLDNMMKAAQLAEKKLGLLKSGRGPHNTFAPSKPLTPFPQFLHLRALLPPPHLHHLLPPDHFRFFHQNRQFCSVVSRNRRSRLAERRVYATAAMKNTRLAIAASRNNFRS